MINARNVRILKIVLPAKMVSTKKQPIVKIAALPVI